MVFFSYLQVLLSLPLLGLLNGLELGCTRIFMLRLCPSQPLHLRLPIPISIHLLPLYEPLSLFLYLFHIIFLSLFHFVLVLLVHLFLSLLHITLLSLLHIVLVLPMHLFIFLSLLHIISISLLHIIFIFLVYLSLILFISLFHSPLLYPEVFLIVSRI